MTVVHHLHLFHTLLLHGKIVVRLVLLLGLIWCGAGCSADWQRLAERQTGVPVRFRYADANARSVCVAGSFNNWSGGTDCLARSGRDSWSLLLFLPPGRYQYRFILNGSTWRTDPHAVLNEQDGFGGQNSVLIVE